MNPNLKIKTLLVPANKIVDWDATGSFLDDFGEAFAAIDDGVPFCRAPGRRARQPRKVVSQRGNRQQNPEKINTIEMLQLCG